MMTEISHTFIEGVPVGVSGHPQDTSGLVNQLQRDYWPKTTTISGYGWCGLHALQISLRPFYQKLGKQPPTTDRLKKIHQSSEYRSTVSRRLRQLLGTGPPFPAEYAYLLSEDNLTEDALRIILDILCYRDGLCIDLGVATRSASSDPVRLMYEVHVLPAYQQVGLTLQDRVIWIWNDTIPSADPRAINRWHGIAPYIEMQTASSGELVHLGGPEAKVKSPYDPEADIGRPEPRKGPSEWTESGRSRTHVPEGHQHDYLSDASMDESPSATHGPFSRAHKPNRIRMAAVPDAPAWYTHPPYDQMTDITLEELIIYFPNHVLRWPGLALLLRQTNWSQLFPRVAKLINKSRGTDHLDGNHKRIQNKSCERKVERAIKELLGPEYTLAKHDEQYSHHIGPNELQQVLGQTPARFNSQMAQRVELREIGGYVTRHLFEGRAFTNRVLNSLDPRVRCVKAPPVSDPPKYHRLIMELCKLYPDNSAYNGFPALNLQRDRYPTHLHRSIIIRDFHQDLCGEVLLYVNLQYTSTEIVSLMLPHFVEAYGGEEVVAAQLRINREQALRTRAASSGRDLLAVLAGYDDEIAKAGFKPRRGGTYGFGARRPSDVIGYLGGFSPETGKSEDEPPDGYFPGGNVTEHPGDIPRPDRRNADQRGPRRGDPKPNPRDYTWKPDREVRFSERDEHHQGRKDGRQRDQKRRPKDNTWNPHSPIKFGPGAPRQPPRSYAENNNRGPGNDSHKESRQDRSNREQKSKEDKRYGARSPQKQDNSRSRNDHGNRRDQRNREAQLNNGAHSKGPRELRDGSRPHNQRSPVQSSSEQSSRRGKGYAKGPSGSQNVGSQGRKRSPRATVEMEEEL